MRVAFDSSSFVLDDGLLRRHVEAMAGLIDTSRISFLVQFRYALLVRLLHLYVDRNTPPAKRARIVEFLTEKVLPCSDFRRLVGRALT